MAGWIGLAAVVGFIYLVFFGKKKAKKAKTKKKNDNWIIPVGILVLIIAIAGGGKTIIPKVLHRAPALHGGPCPSVGLVSAGWINTAAGDLGISCTVVQQQISYESSGQQETSPVGAQGVAQFMPGTWSGMGCTGSVWNVNDAMTCYVKLMKQDLHTENGNLRYALAAYNAGTGNIPAGLGYADHILALAG